MTRRLIGLALTLVLGLVAAPSGSDAQPPIQVARIGFLSLFGDIRSPVVEAFQQDLRELGYVEDQNITIEYRWAEGDHYRLSDFAAELVRLEVDVIVASHTLAIRAAKNGTTTIPTTLLTRPLSMESPIQPIGGGYGQGLGGSSATVPPSRARVL